MGVCYPLERQSDSRRLDPDLKHERTKTIGLDTASEAPKVLGQIGGGHGVRKNVPMYLGYFLILFIRL